MAIGADAGIASIGRRQRRLAGVVGVVAAPAHGACVKRMRVRGGRRHCACGAVAPPATPAVRPRAPAWCGPCGGGRGGDAGRLVILPQPHGFLRAARTPRPAPRTPTTAQATTMPTLRRLAPWACIALATCVACAAAAPRRTEPRRARAAHAPLPTPRANLAGLAASQHAVPLTYDAGVLNRWGFEKATCSLARFLIAKTGMVGGWICTSQGERLVTSAMDDLLRDGCAGEDNLFLDVGSNSGFYGLNAARHGCSVAFVDVQPGCNKVVAGALLVNQMADRGVVVAGGLADAAGTIKADSRGACEVESGRFPMSKLEAGTLPTGDVDVPLFPLGDLLPPRAPVFVVKIDTEGAEQRALQGMMPHFRARSIKHVFVEVTPGHGFWAKQGIDAAAVAATMRDIAACGYTFRNLFDGAEKPALGADPATVHAYFAAPKFDQSDFLITRAA